MHSVEILSILMSEECAKQNMAYKPSKEYATKNLAIMPGEMTAIYLTDSLLVHPHNITHRLTAMENNNDTLYLSFYAAQPDINNISCYHNGLLWNKKIKLTEL